MARSTAENLVRASNKALLLGLVVIGAALVLVARGNEDAVIGVGVGVGVLIVAGVVGQIGRALQGRIL